MSKKSCWSWRYREYVYYSQYVVSKDEIERIQLNLSNQFGIRGTRWDLTYKKWLAGVPQVKVDYSHVKVHFKHREDHVFYMLSNKYEIVESNV